MYSVFDSLLSRMERGSRWARGARACVRVFTNWELILEALSLQNGEPLGISSGERR